ncbi:sensor histidine kinase [Pedobacter aquatilis]|uniref:sensor histidine kinase n=1 Tax=Pedobacter aquatilis TaxID=351343 RepID=UPI0029311893|nr:histidine kinase [Pedobacter aquatilis]
MLKLLKHLENKWVREIILFVILLILTTLNDREDLIHLHELRDGFFVFIILYIHLQFQRFWLLPFLVKGKNFIYWPLAIGLALVFSILAYQIDRWLAVVGWYDEFNGNHGQLFLYYLACCLLSLPILLLAFFIVAFYRQQRTETENQLILKEMEMKLLRNQLDPHFLFNSLNNLYGLSLEKPAEVPERIMQMSQIIRYHLELSKQPQVSLNDDLNFIDHYIAIETSRIAHKVRIDYKKNIEVTERAIFYSIAPMILITFVENAFKHIGYPPSNLHGEILIQVGLTDSILTFSVTNSTDKQFFNPKKSTKVGLKNTKKRLNLLYPKHHNLEIVKRHNSFFIELILKLEEEIIVKNI